MSLTLRSYYRSSCSWRVRIALNWKHISYDMLPIHLVRDGGEQFSLDMRQRNPMRQVPVLTTPQGNLAQKHGHFGIFRGNIPVCAFFVTTRFLSTCAHQARQLSEVINSGIQPIQNLRVLKHLGEVHQFSKEETRAWARYWIGEGLNAFQDLVKDTVGQYCIGDQVTYADLCLVPQLYNARRFDVSVNHFPILLDIEARLAKLPAFQQAHPERQKTPHKNMFSSKKKHRKTRCFFLSSF